MSLQSRLASVKPAGVRSDGYSSSASAVVCAFQADCERSGKCDYNALRAALAWARVPGHVVTLVNLRAVYNDSVYSSAQFATARY